jgi:hypothetical protein
MYDAVPSTWPVSVSWSSSARRAMPKSASASRLRSSSSMLPGFTSRCTTPASWAASRAEAASRSQRRAVRGGIRSPERRRSATVPPLSSSITMNVRPSCSPTS